MSGTTSAVYRSITSRQHAGAKLYIFITKYVHRKGCASTSMTKSDKGQARIKEVHKC